MRNIDNLVEKIEKQNDFVMQGEVWDDFVFTCKRRSLLGLKQLDWYTFWFVCKVLENYNL